MPSFSVLWWSWGRALPAPPKAGALPLRGRRPGGAGRGSARPGSPYRYSQAKASPAACTVWSMSPWVWA